MQFKVVQLSMHLKYRKFNFDRAIEDGVLFLHLVLLEQIIYIHIKQQIDTIY